MTPPQDTSDAQYRGFRSHFPALCALACIHLLVTRVNGALKAKGRLTWPSLDVDATAVFCIATVLALHGSSAFKILAILGMNYMIAVASQGSIWGIIATWAFNISVLVANQVFQGYQYGSLHPVLAPLVSLMHNWQLRRTLMNYLHDARPRILSVESTLVGISSSILRCSAWFHSTWITSGHLVNGNRGVYANSSERVGFSAIKPPHSTSSSG